MIETVIAAAGKADQAVRPQAGRMAAQFAVEPEQQAEHRGDAQPQHEVAIGQCKGNGSVQFHQALLRLLAEVFFLQGFGLLAFSSPTDFFSAAIRSMTLPPAAGGLFRILEDLLAALRFGFLLDQLRSASA